MKITIKKLSTVALLATFMAAHPAFAKTHLQPIASDLALAQKVESHLKSSGVLEEGLTEVRVESHDGDIVLSGWLRHADDDSKVIAAAKKVDGVGAVRAFFRTWSSRRHPS